LASVALLVLTAAAGLSACGGGSEPASKPAAKTPAPTAAKPAGGQGDAVAGKEVFASSGCEGCHKITREKSTGPGLAGVTGKPKLPNGKPMNDANLMVWIKDGGSGSIGTMPPNPSLTPAQLGDLVAYLKTLR
jgi:mono/diheme cytochrome c family protein